MSRKSKKFDEESEIPKALRKRKNYEDDDDLPKAVKRNKKKKKAKKKFKKYFIIFLVIVLVLLLVWGFIRIHTWTTLAQDMLANTNSQVLDTNNNVIAQIGSEKIKEPISYSKIPENLKDAYIAIEDKRFYNHHGVDIKRTASAIFSYVIHFGSSSFGGSTITQQLVKNMTGDDSATPARKMTEWVKALTLETCMSKEEILDTYLNIIYVGPNIYGVEMGAKYYFNKSVSDLSLAECAFLAGINHSPNSYNPFGNTDKTEKITNRTDIVLNEMLEQDYITEEECNTAKQEVENGLAFSQGTVTAKSNGVYSYHTDALINEVVEDLCNKKKISKSFATNYLNMANLTIYSTQDSNIQQAMETEFEKTKYVLQSANDPNATSQAAMVVIDHKTGKVVGCIGGLGEKTEARSLNRATQSARQTGSAIKPIAILAPALKEKIITPASIYVDEPTTFDDGSEEGYSPVDYDPYLGSITVRRAVESSQNIPFVTMMEQLTPEKSVKYLEKMGVTTLTENDYELPLALGGLDKGMTPLETAAAYATIANNGVYIEPIFYTRVENQDRKTVIENKQTKRKVFSESVAYVLQKLLTVPVTGSNGTATYCAISGMDVAAKTGTTNENYDRWLCGFTPYYTAATWYGFDLNETIRYGGRNPAGVLWAYVMRSIHSGLENAKFEMPKRGVESATICGETGKLANSGCPDRYTEYFVKGTLPDKCTLHSGSSDNVKSNRNTTNITRGLEDEDNLTDTPTPSPQVTQNPPPQTTTEQNSSSSTNTTNTTNNNNTATNTSSGSQSSGSGSTTNTNSGSSSGGSSESSGSGTTPPTEQESGSSDTSSSTTTTETETE